MPTLRRSESAACSHSGCDENPETAALVRGTLGFVAVMLHVCFGCLNGMVGCVVEMPLGAMGVVLGRLAMVLSCLLVVLCTLMSGHVYDLLLRTRFACAVSNFLDLSLLNSAGYSLLKS